MSGPSNLRQAPWGYLSQATNTGTNFLLTVLVARGAGTAAFGAFAVIMVVYTIGIGVTRATAGDVLAVLRRRDTSRRARAEGEAVAHTIALGILLGLAVAVVVLAVADHAEQFLPIAYTMPLLLMQESLRGVALVRGAPREAALSDGLWALVQLGTVAVAVAVTGAVTPVVVVVSWCAGGALSGLTSLLRLRVRIRPSAAPHWFREHRAVAAPLLVSHLLVALPVDASFLLMPLVTNLVEVGTLRAAFLFYGPLGVLLLGTRSMLLPDATRLGSPGDVRRLVGWVTVLQAAVAAAWGTGVVLLPDAAGRWLLGPTWDGTQGPRFFLALMLTAEMVLVGALVAATALGLLNRVAAVQAVTVPLILTIVLVVTAVHGATGSAAALAVGTGVTALLAWLALLFPDVAARNIRSRPRHHTESGST